MKIKGIEGISGAEMALELAKGGKFVVYQYAISIIILTFKRSSDIYFVKAGENRAGKGALFTILTILFGWWGIPWGPVYSIQALINNFKGGKDVTDEVLAAIRKSSAAAPAGAVPAK